MKKAAHVILCLVLLSAGCKKTPLPEPAFFEVSSDQIKFKGKGGDIRIEVKSSSEWDVSVLWPDQDEWLSITPGKGENGSILVTIEALPNDIFSDRTVTIRFWSNDGIMRLLEIIQAARDPDPLAVEPASLDYPAAGTTDYLSVETTIGSWEVTVTEGSDWCFAEKEGTETVKVRARVNPGDEREATIRITADEYTKDVVLTQQAYDKEEYYGDKLVFSLQQSTADNGIDLIVLGDGYTLDEMGRDGTGKYETDMRAAADHFFSVYPYSVYRDWFNVYMVTALSEEAGMSSTIPPVSADTRFQSVWQGGNSTLITCNSADVRSYVTAVTELTGKEMKDVTVIMPINSSVYAGTCQMWSDGFSISSIPVGSMFGKVVVHEAGGHGFAKLIDEYIYYDRTIPQETKEHIEMMKQDFGFYINADFSDNIAETTWSCFAGHPKYPMVGTYAGAYMYRKGIWRPEQNSCMNDNTLYFNAPSRWAQVKRIHELAGIPYSFDQFLLEDAVPVYPAAALSAAVYPEQFVPTAPPVVFTTPSESW